MTKVKEILEFLEEHLDADHIVNTRGLLKKALNYEPLVKIPLKVNTSYRRFTGYSVKETFEDMEKMMVNELCGYCQAADLKDATMPTIRANYGVGILPSLFGLNSRILENNLPWVDHLGSVDEIKKLMDKGIPDIRNGFGAKILDTHAYYYEQLAKYPKCNELIKVYHPDLQGPFDVAHLIWGGEIYYGIYDEPELIHDLMNLITDTYMAFMKEIKKGIQDEEENGKYHYHWGTLYPGKYLLRDDSPVNLSKDAYEEFVKPYDQRILDEFGEASMHYCGRGDQWVFSMMECKGLKALNFGQPPNLEFGFDFLEKIYGQASSLGIANVGYVLDKSQIPDLVRSKYTTGVTYTTYVDKIEEAEELLKICGW